MTKQQLARSHFTRGIVLSLVGAVAIPAGGQLAQSSSSTLEDVRTHMVIAQRALGEECFDDATSALLWIWDSPAARAEYDSIRTFSVSMLARQVAACHDRSKRRFVDVRDALERELTQELCDTQRRDWMILNDIVNDNARTAQWFRLHGVTQLGDARCMQTIGSRLEAALLDQNEWGAYGSILQDPASRVRTLYPLSTLRNQATDSRVVPVGRDPHSTIERARRQTSTMYAGLLAAGRAEEATHVAELALDLDRGARLRGVLVERALDAGQGREIHKKWLDTASAAGEPVGETRERLERALGRAK